MTLDKWINKGRLQQPGSYVVLKYVRKVVKRLDTKTILTPPAPANVLERSAVDVSFLAGMLVDKFSYHLQIYGVHPPAFPVTGKARTCGVPFHCAGAIPPQP